jgi:predicted Zn-dependent protease
MDRAVAEVEKVYQDRSVDPRLVVRLADMYVGNQTPDKAVKVIRTYLERSTESELRFTLRILLARALLMNGQDAEGTQLFEELQKAAPGDNALLGTYLQTLCQMKAWTRAEAIAATIVESQPDLNVLLSMARRIFRQDDQDLWRIVSFLLERGMEQEPDNPSVDSALFTLAQLAQANGEMELSVDYYRRLAARTGDKSLGAVASNNLAWILGIELGKLEDAYAITTDALDNFPDYLDLKDTHGVICWRLDKTDEAIQYLRECVEKYPAMNPAGTGSRFHLGQVYSSIGKREEARNLLLEARRMNEEIGGLSAKDVAELMRLLGELQ